MHCNKKSRRLHRSCDYKVFAGVCAGLADYFDLSPQMIRIMFIVGFILSAGGALLVYLLLWIVMPKRCYRLSSCCCCYEVHHERA
jgi:phage shock protein C